MPRHICIQTYIRIKKKKKKKKKINLSVVMDLTPSIHHKYFFWHFFTVHINGKRCNSQSEVVCVYHVLSLLLHGFVCTIFGPDMKTEMGVFMNMYLKHSPDYNDSKYIYGFIGQTP